MEHLTPSPVYDHVAINNRARALRAEAMATGARAIRRWVARNWAALTHHKGHQPA